MSIGYLREKLGADGAPHPVDIDAMSDIEFAQRIVDGQLSLDMLDDEPVRRLRVQLAQVKVKAYVQKRGKKYVPVVSYKRRQDLAREDYEGKVGERSHITANEKGEISTAAIRYLRGVEGEMPGAHRNKRGEDWERFKRDIATNGIKEPIFITVDHGDVPRISEGNHRRDAAVELGLDMVPVHIRYFGHAEQEGTVAERYYGKDETPVSASPAPPDDWRDPGDKPQFEAGEKTDEELRRNREERQSWTAQMAEGVAIGAISPEAATARGWYSNARPEEIKPLPPVLYHATTGLSKVLADGLKTKSDRDNATGLGGAGEEISLTENRAYADRIATVLKELRSVLREETSVEEIEERARRDGVYDRMVQLFESGQGFWEQRVKRRMRQGVTGAITTPEEYTERRGPEDAKWTVKPGAEPLVGGDEKKRYIGYNLERPLNEEERLDMLRHVYDAYIWAAGEAKIADNPVMFAPDLKWLASLDESDIGVVEVHPRPGAHGWQNDAMRQSEWEWRTWSGKALDVRSVESTALSNSEVKLASARAWIPAHPSKSAKGKPEWVDGHWRDISGLGDLSPDEKKAISKSPKARKILRDSLGSPGRGATGGLRNFKAMSPEKLDRAIEELRTRADDPDALKAAEAARELKSPGDLKDKVAPAVKETPEIPTEVKKVKPPKIPKKVVGLDDNQDDIDDAENVEDVARWGEAFDWYQGSYMLNRNLREGTLDDDEDRAVVIALDEAMDAATPMTKPAETFRGAELPVEFRGQDPETLVGKTWVENAFTSTAGSYQDEAEGYLDPEGRMMEGFVTGPPVLMRIIVAPGTKYVSRDWTDATEYVLDRNLRYTIAAVEKGERPGGVDEETEEEYPAMPYMKMTVLAEPAGDKPKIPKPRGKTTFDTRLAERLAREREWEEKYG